ncbi:hypothetical protein EW146_g7635 [Bondarzewia mesenterica]|uniref:Zinc finger Mcm10/DnaG-type domain-containing protein n=1 Tax=Bondarzewia mesenterica TaxID=1095465 RepID=A0A4S4LKT5_9AGAM|nr:hypothetical protein EW146_g7635 [Bondarzewia mesenterica]
MPSLKTCLTCVHQTQTRTGTPAEEHCESRPGSLRPSSKQSGSLPVPHQIVLCVVMDSAASRKLQEERRQADIRKQIAALQAQLNDPSSAGTSAALSGFESPKRKRNNGTLLAPATPSPKKRKIISESTAGDKSGIPKAAVRPTDTRPASEARRSSAVSSSAAKPSVVTDHPRPSPQLSNVLSKLSQLGGRSQKPAHPEITDRSSSFTEKSIPKDVKEALTPGDAPSRDDRLALIEDLEPGPVDHKPPFDDPLFEKLEPYSGIHLSSRAISHEDVQEYLTGRFYLSPSRLYSVIRLLPNKQGYDVPVPGDWVTIAVVAERGPIKLSRAPVATNRTDEQDDDAEHKDSSAPHDRPQKDNRIRKGKDKDDAKDGSYKTSSRKYVNLKLIDFGARSKTSATGGKSVIRGDAFLTLLLFESDSFDLVTKEEGGRKQKIYKGGSKGAFESMAKLKEGSVVALLNPRVLKPFQRSADTPHPTNNILALTPESAGSVAVIGHARDLGMCTVVKRDGKVCGSWCDKKVSDVCDYHVQKAVERRRAGRAEFSIGTSGLSTAAPKRKPAYDPAQKWGLKPDPDKGSLAPNDGGGATYIVSGHVVSSSQSRGLFVGESLGRDAQAKAQRKATLRETDNTLKKLLERDREGMKAVTKAREYAEKMKEQGKVTKSKEKLREIALARSSKDIELGSRPGRQRSAVSAPPRRTIPMPTEMHAGNDLPEISDDELEREEKAIFGKSLESPPKLVYLDSSDANVEPEDEESMREPSDHMVDLNSEDEEGVSSNEASVAMGDPDSSDEEFQRVFGKSGSESPRGVVELGDRDDE